MKQNFIITGTSRGIGKSLALKVKQENHYCVGVARGASPQELDEQYSFDLANLKELASWIKRFQIPAEGPIWLVNNAGVIEPIGKVGSLKNDDIEQIIKLNLIVPMILTNELMARFGANRMNILNISSGAANRPYPGWSGYCASKAGLEMFSKVLMKEQPDSQVVSLTPGTVNTQMQTSIRNQSEETFPMKQKFVHLFETNALMTPEVAANKIYTFLTHNEVSGIFDLRYN